MVVYKMYYLVGEYQYNFVLDKIGARRFYPVIKKREPKNYLASVCAPDMEHAIEFFMRYNVIRREQGYLVFDTGLFTSFQVSGFAK